MSIHVIFLSDPIGVITIIAADAGSKATETRGYGSKKHSQPYKG